MQETWFRSLDQEGPLDKEMATHSSILAWKIPWTEKLSGQQSMGSQESDTTQQLNHHLSVQLREISLIIFFFFIIYFIIFFYQFPLLSLNIVIHFPCQWPLPLCHLDHYATDWMLWKCWKTALLCNCNVLVPFCWHLPLKHLTNKQVEKTRDGISALWVPSMFFIVRIKLGEIPNKLYSPHFLWTEFKSSVSCTIKYIRSKIACSSFQSSFC